MMPSLLAWVLGSAGQLWQPILFDIHKYMAISAVSGVLIAYSAIKYIAIKNTWIKRFPPLHVSILSMALAGMAFGVTGWRASVYSAQALPAELEGKDIQVIGIVAAMPQQSEVGLRFRFAVEQAEIETAVKLPKLIELSWYSGAYRTEANTSVATSAATTMPVPQFELQGKPQTIKPGERWQMTVRLKAIHGNSNPHGFDYELYQWEQGVQATGYVRATANDVPPKKIGDTWKYSIERLRAKVRDAVFERLSFSNSAGATSNNAGVTSNNAGVVAALVTGDQRAIDRTDWDIFRATGVAHLMSISGLHITLFAWVAAGVVAWLWRRKSWSSTLCLYFPAPSAGLVGGLLLATAYAAFSGWGVPAQRTILMLATVSLLKLSGHRWPWYVVWTMACAIVVVVDPWALLQAGFWLSFVAVAVLFATDKQKLATDSQKAVQVESVETFHQAIQHSLQRAQGERHWVFKKLQTLAEKSGALLREQWVITLALTPLTMMLFGQVSVVGLLANLLAIPWVTLVVTPLSLLGAFFAPVWDVAAWSVQVLSVVLTSLSKLPFATFSVAAAPFYLSVLGILGGLLLVFPMAQNRKWQWKLGALGLSLLLPVLLWQAPRPESGQFELLAADIGQGNAVVIRTQNHSLLYDAGPRYSVESDAGHRVLVPLLRAMGERLDMVMLSHRDSDHAGGIKSVLASHPVAQFVSSVESSNELQNIKPATRCEAGQKWQWDGVDFAVLHPTGKDYDTPQKPNALSCVLRISSKGVSATTDKNGKGSSVLLTADIEQSQELRLLANALDLPESLQSTVLLVPHHGSKTSSSTPFLDAVKPDFGIVQAGYRNRFKHPVPEVMTRYQDRQIRVIDSPHCGALMWSSSKPKEVRCHRAENQRYWHHQLPELEPNH